MAPYLVFASGASTVDLRALYAAQAQNASAMSAMNARYVAALGGASGGMAALTQPTFATAAQLAGAQTLGADPYGLGAAAAAGIPLTAYATVGGLVLYGMMCELTLSDAAAGVVQDGQSVYAVLIGCACREYGVVLFMFEKLRSLYIL